MDPGDHQRGQHDASGQEDPKLKMIVEVGSVMNALDQIGAAEGHLQDLGRLGVDLDLIAILALHFDHALTSSRSTSSQDSISASGTVLATSRMRSNPIVGSVPAPSWVGGWM